MIREPEDLPETIDDCRLMFECSLNLQSDIIKSAILKTFSRMEGGDEEKQGAILRAYIFALGIFYFKGDGDDTD